ncbi:hypothetical protein M433DRAFT_8672 [Acidomyces richmondensis BFW]|nr:MAG: hypothetical protein FE78DRAFT_31563 [Acidomyces sp. 'richmondensis']KYG40570.1 hypothetical protein M433DRAFT_8672 [Acidomyces richmondensis BFW]
MSMDIDQGSGTIPLGQGHPSEGPATPKPIRIEQQTTPTKQGKFIPVLPAKKRSNPYTEDSPIQVARRQKDSTLVAANNTAATDKIKKARSLLVEAAALLQDNCEEQSKVLDLIEVFREYVEKKEVKSTIRILATQVASLEAATSRITQQTKKPLFTEVLRGKTNQDNNQNSEKWTTVTRNRTNAPRGEKETKTKTPTRITLSLENKDFEVDPRKLRDNLNKFLTERGAEGLSVTAATKSMKNNLVLTLTDPGRKDLILNHLGNLKEKIPIGQLIEDDTWYKVVVHGVSTKDFDTLDGEAQVKKDLELFNKGFTVVGTPIWLTKKQKREQQQGGSMLLAFRTLEEAKRAVETRLFIGGVSVRAEKARDKPRIQQDRRTAKC